MCAHLQNHHHGRGLPHHEEDVMITHHHLPKGHTRELTTHLPSLPPPEVSLKVPKHLHPWGALKTVTVTAHPQSPKDVREGIQSMTRNLLQTNVTLALTQNLIHKLTLITGDTTHQPTVHHRQLPAQSLSIVMAILEAA